MDTKLSDKYIMARKTVIDMLIDRGYNIINPYKSKIYIKENIEDIINKYGFKESMIKGIKNNDEIDVYFLFEKIGIKQCLHILEEITKSNIKKCILICKGGFTHYAENKIKDFVKDVVKIEMFLFEEMLYNITKHIYQPKFELIKDKIEIKKILNTWKIKKTQCLIIKKNNPINRYFNGNVGEIYKVIHQGGIIDYQVIAL